jgi:hypothetical protein
VKSIFVFAGPGPARAKKENASALRKANPEFDALVCRTTSDLETSLRIYGSTWLHPLLFYVLPNYPDGVQNWSAGFLKALDSEVSRRNLSVLPTEVKVTAVQKDRGFYIKCPFVAAQADSIIEYVKALDVAFAQTDWRPKTEKQMVGVLEVEPSKVNPADRYASSDFSVGHQKGKGIMNWYYTNSEKTNVRQIVLQATPENEVDRTFGTLLLSAKFLSLQTNIWATGFFNLDSDPGPFLMVRGDKVASKLKGYPITVAICFYRMRTGGLVTIYVHVDCPTVAKMLSDPIVLFENSYGLDYENRGMKEIIERAIGNEALHICFTEGEGPAKTFPDGSGFESKGIESKFDVVIPLTHECRAILKKEYDSLLRYHENISSSTRNYKQSVQQMWAQNPHGSNPILPPPADATSEIAEHDQPKKPVAVAQPQTSQSSATLSCKEPIAHSKGTRPWWKFWGSQNRSIAETAVERGHKFRKGVCIRCGSSEKAVLGFGWECKPIDDGTQFPAEPSRTGKK